MKKLLCSFAGVAALGLSLQANAVPVYFDISAASTARLVEFEGTEKPVITVNSRELDRQRASLSAGDEWSFKFFSIVLPAAGWGSGTIDASLLFDKPTDAEDAGGSATGSFFSFFIGSLGELVWDTQPGLFSLANGATYSVLFQDRHGITPGQKVDVRAYLTLHSEGVPEPGMLALFGLGVLGVMLANRRRLAVRKV